MSAVRHKARTKARAIALRDAGWSVAAIRRLLASEGVDPVPSPNTVWCWVSEAYNARQRRHKLLHERAKRLANASYRFPGVRSPEWMLGRMRALRGAGLSCNAIAKVISHDFPTPVTENEVREALLQGRPPLALRLADKQGAAA